MERYVFHMATYYLHVLIQWSNEVELYSCAWERVTTDMKSLVVAGHRVSKFAEGVQRPL